MSLSGDSEQNRYLQDLVGFEGDNLKIAVEPASDSTHSDNTGNISLADFHSAPKFNKLIVGGVIVLTCTFLGFFFFNRAPVSSEVSALNEQPTEKEPPILEKSSQDSRVGQLKTEVALSDQQQAMKDQKIEPPSPRSPRSLTQSPRSASPLPNQRRAQTVSPPAPPVRTLENSSSPSSSYAPPPRVAFRPVARVARYVPPPFSIRRRPTTVASLSPRASSGATSARPLSYQFGVPSPAKNDNSDLEGSRQAQAEIPPNYQAYYPNRGTDADSDLSPTSHQSVSSIPAAKLVNAPSPVPTSPVALSPAEQRFLEGRPMMRSVPVGTQIFAQIFQATAVDNAQQGDKVLLRVSQTLADAQGKQLIPTGTLIGATLQIGAGGVARVTPEVIYLNARPFALPANSLIVALRDGNPLVAERIERGGGDRGGINPLGLLVDTGTTLLPFLSSGSGSGDSNGFRDFYQYQRLNDYANRNFGGVSNQRGGNYAQQASQPAVYFKLPANLDVQMLVVTPFELPL